MVFELFGALLVLDCNIFDFALIEYLKQLLIPIKHICKIILEGNLFAIMVFLQYGYDREYRIVFV